MAYDIIPIAQGAVDHGASDIHLATGNRPAYRIDGRIRYFGEHPLSAEDVDGMARQCLNQEKYQEFAATGDVDAAKTFEGISRFRVNVMKTTRGPALIMRTIKSKTPRLASLNLPPSIQRVLDFREGLILVTGPTGSGKSTTLAAIINELNLSRSDHIITIEDPIEYIHQPAGCIINQRETGDDTADYARALKAALREDPDIILVGEMRDLESISIALTAAETGHLVLSTLHTLGAAKTIDRLIDTFPTAQQTQVRVQLSGALKAVISQRLMPSTKGGRRGAFEMMFVNSAIANLIRENKTSNISQSIQTGAGEGMITLDRSVLDLIVSGEIDKKTAEEYGFDLEKLAKLSSNVTL